jgi:hypothetical protein
MVPGGSAYIFSIYRSLTVLACEWLVIFSFSPVVLLKKEYITQAKVDSFANLLYTTPANKRTM